MGPAPMGPVSAFGVGGIPCSGGAARGRSGGGRGPGLRPPPGAALPDLSTERRHRRLAIHAVEPKSGDRRDPQTSPASPVVPF